MTTSETNRNNKQEFFKWDESFETGITKIDIQHKVIVKILNELYDAVIHNKEEEKMGQIINELVQYTVYHFEEEEKLFERYGFPHKEEHKKEHQKFIEKINDAVKLLETDSTIVALDLITFLKDWLTEHILITDGEYSKYFKKEGISIK
jgi:hemerythrin